MDPNKEEKQGLETRFRIAQFRLVIALAEAEVVRIDTV